MRAQILENFRQGKAQDEVDVLPEAALMASMEHPNVMRTFAHATRVKQHRAGVATFEFADNDGGSGGHVLETWLLLEYCNKGSLQVSCACKQPYSYPCNGVQTKRPPKQPCHLNSLSNPSFKQDMQQKAAHILCLRKHRTHQTVQG